MSTEYNDYTPGLWMNDEETTELSPELEQQALAVKESAQLLQKEIDELGGEEEIQKALESDEELEKSFNEKSHKLLLMSAGILHILGGVGAISATGLAWFNGESMKLLDSPDGGAIKLIFTLVPLIAGSSIMNGLRSIKDARNT